MRFVAGAVLAFCLASPASATLSPLALYSQGQFSQAEAAGVAENDAAGLAIAARAVLADAAMRDEPCLECLKHAEDLAQRAIAADPKQPEGHIYYAVAVGYETRIIGNFAAQSRGYADRAKRELDAALDDDPNDAWALATLGSWHIEIVHSAGPTLARWFFGARFEKGRGYYEKALAIAPDNLVIHYQYALTLAAFDLETYRQEVEDELAHATAISPNSAYETFARNRARDLLDTLKRGDNAGAERLVRRDQGYPA